MFRRIGELFLGRILFGLIAVVILLLLLWMFRIPLLKGVGNFLITPDPVEQCDALYVLGGAPLERGAEGARLLLDGVAPVMICTGLNIPTPLMVEDIMLSEAELSRNMALRTGADPERVVIMPVGTSTWEEAEAIFMHAQENDYRSVTIVSTEFHLRRVGRVFRKRFAGTGIAVRVHGAQGAMYDSARWWESEPGLLMVNNEYVKLVYYWINY